MSPKRKCFCCDESDLVKKPIKQEGLKIDCSLHVPYVSLVRLEDDPKLQNYLKKNFKTDFICRETGFTLNQSKNSSKKTETYSNINTSSKKITLIENNIVSNDSVLGSKTKRCINEIPEKKEIARKSFCNSTSSEVVPNNVQTKDKKFVPIILISDTLKNKKEQNKRILKEVTGKILQHKNDELTSSNHPESGAVKKIKLDSNEGSTASVNFKSNHIHVKLDENGQSVSTDLSFEFVDCGLNSLSKRADDCGTDVKESDSLEDLKNGNDCYSVSKHKLKKCDDILKETLSFKATDSSHLKENIKVSSEDLSKGYDKTVLNNLDFEEPLTLITKLTGCQIAPSKIKILPLSTPCISNPSETFFSEKIVNNNIEIIEEKQVETVQPKVSSEEETSNSASLPEDCENSNGSIKDSVSESTNVLENEKRPRTIYDVMNDVSLILPSWNLHILPDTNTFCLGQVTRNKLGIPHLSKCIELDDNFNAKVFICQQHCKKFDGVYNSEETVIALLNEIDKYH